MSRSGGGDGVETGMHFRGIRALAAASGADMTIGVMYTLGVHRLQNRLHSWDSS